MENKNMNSRFLSINWKDGLKGFVIAVVGSLLGTLMEMLNKGALPDYAEIRKALVLGIGAGVSYVGTTFISNSKRELLKPDPEHIVVSDETPVANVTATVTSTPTNEPQQK